MNEPDYSIRLKLANDFCLRPAQKGKTLGARMTSRSSNHNACLKLDVTHIAGQIRAKSATIARLEALKLPQKGIYTFAKAFIGGTFNYYTPWLAGEIHEGLRKELRPLQTAYHA